jgi:hypothetical protein
MDSIGSLDALEELESATPRRAADDGGPTTPHEKRRRIAQRRSPHVKLEGTVAEEEYGVITPRHCKHELDGASPKAEEMALDAVEKFCAGCGRSQLHSTCYIKRTPIQWGLPDGRGMWCRDCHNCWRLMYAAVSTLVMFAVWLRRPTNATEWEFTLVSFLSLKQEGIERVSEGMVRTRKAMLEFVFRMLSVPTGPFEVMSLGEADLSQELCKCSR